MADRTRKLTRIVLSGLLLAPAWSQARGNPKDASIEQIRIRSEFSQLDQTTMADWVQAEMDEFTDFATFRKRVSDLYGKSGTTDQFKLHFATRAAQVAAGAFEKPTTKPDVSHALAQLLADMDRPETLPGLLAGLKSSDARARYVCGRGLVSQKKTIAADKAKAEEAVKALRDAGLAETDAVVLGRIYEAMGIPPAQAPGVADAFIAVFDKRITARKARNADVDGAELYAYEFFRNKAVAGAMPPPQQAQLVARLAVFLRLDAERYEVPSLTFDELDTLERCLDGLEDSLTVLVGEGKGGKIRDVLNASGHSSPAAIRPEVVKWIGAASGEKGVLNDAPWSVAPGAP